MALVISGAWTTRRTLTAGMQRPSDEQATIVPMLGLRDEQIRISIFSRTAKRQNRTHTNEYFVSSRESTKSNPKATLIRLNANQFVRYTMDWAGRTQYALVGASVNGQLKGNLFLNFEAGDQYEKDYEEEFRSPGGPVPAFFGAPTRSAQIPYFS